MKKQFYTKLLSTIVLLMAFVSCKNENSKKEITTEEENTDFTINGTIKGLDSGWVKLGYPKDGVFTMDSTKVDQNGAFSFVGQVAYPLSAMLLINDDATSFYLENSAITIDAVKDALSRAVVSGSDSNEDYKEYALATKAFDEKMKPINDTLRKLYFADLPLPENLEKQLDELQRKKEAATKKYIKNNPASYVAANKVAELFAYNPDIPEFEQAYADLDVSIKESPLGKKIASSIEIVKKTAIGSPSLDFTMNDVNDQPITLSSLKGKYVLLEFWASWCLPCRKENPSLKMSYTTYGPRGFEILAVSWDTKKENWLNAIAEDGLPWLHVSDLKEDNAAIRLYNIQGVPINYLLDPEGKIIAKSLNGEELSHKLAEIF